VAADTSGRLADFGALASNSRFGTNVFATKLSWYGRVGEITPSVANPSDAFRPRREHSRTHGITADTSSTGR
jgi:hypothetical protein